MPEVVVELCDSSQVAEECEVFVRLTASDIVVDSKSFSNFSSDIELSVRDFFVEDTRSVLVFFLAFPFSSVLCLSKETMILFHPVV